MMLGLAGTVQKPQLPFQLIWHGVEYRNVLLAWAVRLLVLHSGAAWMPFGSIE
jgi:hypothetical protein